MARRDPNRWAFSVHPRPAGLGGGMGRFFRPEMAGYKPKQAQGKNTKPRREQENPPVQIQIQKERIPFRGQESNQGSAQSLRQEPAGNSSDQRQQQALGNQLAQQAQT